MATFIGKAVEVLKEATEADNAGKKEDAIRLYLRGTEFLMAALKYEKVPGTIKLLQQKADQYITRVEQLKAGDSPQVAAMGASVDSGNLVSSKDVSDQKSRDEIDKLQGPPLEQFTISKEVAANVEPTIRQVMVGQSFAIASVSAAIKRWAEGWVDPDKPLVWLFIGMSGTGKTELAKGLAAAIFGKGDSSAFVRVDMSEFQDKSAVNKFLGASPGFIGYGEGAQLVNALEAREGKGAIVLLDEVEKAHPDILTILLQVFDEGRITTSKGKTLDCKQAIFIMTSNVGAAEIAKLGAELRNPESHQPTKDDPPTSTSTQYSLISAEEHLIHCVEPALKEAFKRDEFIGRISEIIPFLPFTQDEVEQIVVKILEKWSRVAQEKHSIKLHWAPIVVSILANEYNPKYGVRSLKNIVEKKVLNQLAASTHSGIVKPGQEAEMTAKPTSQGNYEIVVQPVRPLVRSEPPGAPQPLAM